MAMIVQHNISAMNVQRQLNINSAQRTKATERLSSGYRINRAADDAAGLAISEKMRSQIRGLNRATANAQDGISMIQTAEGALSETHSMLQRMRELAVQASNGTETDKDRANLQDEIEQLQEEIERISTDTEFNTMPLLDGSLGGGDDSITSAGPKFGAYNPELEGFVTSNVPYITVRISTTAKAGTESALWLETKQNKPGVVHLEREYLVLNLEANHTYSQADIDNLIKNARKEDSTANYAIPELQVNLKNGAFTTGAVKSQITSGNSYTVWGGTSVPDNTTITVVSDKKITMNSRSDFGPARAEWVSDTEINVYNMLSGYQHQDARTLSEVLANASNKPADCPNLSFYYSPTEAGVKAESGYMRLFDPAADQGKYIGANVIKLKSNRYGYDSGMIIYMDTLAKPGEESAKIVKANKTNFGTPNNGHAFDATEAAYEIKLSIAAGKEYTEKDLEKLLKEAGVDIDVELISADPDEPDTLFITQATNLSATVNADVPASVVALGGTYKEITLPFLYMGKSVLRDAGGTLADVYGAVTGRGLGDDDAFIGEPNYDVVGDGGSGVLLQVGANEGQTMSFSIGDMSTRALGIGESKVNIATQAGAQQSITRIDYAINKVSKQRAELGAVQNRLEHTIMNLGTGAENLQAAESQIRDADMSAEMVALTRTNVLSEAGQSMLSKANSSPEGVLNLLRV